MKHLFLTLLLVFITQNCFSQDKKDDFKILDNISIKDTIYSVKYKIDKSEFLLKICNSDTCHITQSYAKGINPKMLRFDILNLVKRKMEPKLDINSVLPEDNKHIENLLITLKQKEFEDLEAQKDDLQKTLEAVDTGKNQYSGRLIINKEVPYSIKKDKYILGTGSLKIINSKVQFFNNKASSIYIKAELTQDGKTEKLIFLNNQFSVALRYFNNYGSTVTSKTKNLDDIRIDYNDVFDYESDQFFNYSIANDQISLATESQDSISSKVVQRRFFDFFTAIIYSDVLSFNTENSNSLLNAQAKLLLPLNLRNWRKLSFMRQFTTSTNIALSSSFEDVTRFISIVDDETFSNFELLKKNNLYGKIDVQAITLEYKRLFLNISLGYSAAFYRTGFKYTQTVTDADDIVTNQQLLSLGHGPFLNFEIRPQTNFGADIIVSLEDLNYNDTKEINGRNFINDIIVDGGKNHFGVKYNIVNIR